MPEAPRPPRRPAIAFKTFTPAEVLLWAAGPVVLAVMALLFSGLADVLGRKRGYLAAFCVYWAGFGFAFPLLVVGPARLLPALRFATLPGGIAGIGLSAALVIPPVLAGATVFRKRVREATAAALFVSAALALVNASAEELLWRASFVRTFHDPALGLLLPALGFAAWHLAPLIVLPAEQPGGAAAFVGASLVLGLMWGAVAYATGSIALTWGSHVLTDFLGLGGLAYVASRTGEPARLDR